MVVLVKAVHQVPLVNPENLVPPAPKVHLEKMAMVEVKENLDRKVHPGQLGLRVQREHQGPTANKAVLVHQALLDLPEKKANQVQKVHPANLVNLEVQAKMLSTARVPNDLQKQLYCRLDTLSQVQFQNFQCFVWLKYITVSTYVL